MKVAQAHAAAAQTTWWPALRRDCDPARNGLSGTEFFAAPKFD